MAMSGVPKSWMGHPKEYTALTDILSAYSSAFGNSDDLDKQLFSSPDWYSVFYPSTSDSHLDFHLLHHPSPTINAQHPRKPATAMMNQHSFPGNHIPLVDDKRYGPLRVEDHSATAYSQSVSPFATRHDLNSTLSSNGSTYCESDLESLEQYDEPSVARTVDTHAGLVHPTPRSSMFMVAGNSFLLGTEETSSLSSFGVSDIPRDEQAFSNSQFNVPNPNNANCPMGTPFNPHPQHAHLTPSITPPDAKPVDYDQHISWPVCQSANPDIWYPTRDPNGSSEDSGWHTHNSYSAPWPVTNAYTCPAECNEPATHAYGMSSGLPMPSFGSPFVPLGSSTPITHQSYMPAYVPTVEAPARYHPTPQPMYLPSTHPVSPNTEFGSPDQKPANSLSPSFSVSTNEEEQSPQESGEEQSGIYTGLHYSDERNTFLIDCKRRGLSYKDIKRVGRFKEAESTLRGRYRTLTKSKDQRVRKPKWQDKDIRLLCEAVSIHGETHDAYNSLTNISMNMSEPPKVSWKKVAEHIWRNGGSYHFGNATCKKKWCEIHNITI
ncbi:hypothetical protein N7517_003931 [Penicillium concentricum]|uniref:Myb-like domain-containing protein n=1 Tax=Penicillium concentricum TaxID=293559 RepID=A0A9W9S5W0_9EURO|nr:uncharacterized protein N7517_003931 [Penicillium concentricum]KAJ5371925.1 hypothetical protein N7517_003931 [Penicillium concentricum]